MSCSKVCKGCRDRDCASVKTIYLYPLSELVSCVRVSEEASSDIIRAIDRSTRLKPARFQINGKWGRA
jgi:hypothetical protein